MKKLAVLLTVLWLGGCAQLSAITGAWNYAEGVTVTPQAILIASNAFNVLEGTATNYFNYCRPRLAEAICSADNRRKVIRGVRTGRQARTTLESYFDRSAPAPAVVYNTLIDAISILQKTTISTVGATK